MLCGFEFTRHNHEMRKILSNSKSLCENVYGIFTAKVDNCNFELIIESISVFCERCFKDRIPCELIIEDMWHRS